MEERLTKELNTLEMSAKGLWRDSEEWIRVNRRIWYLKGYLDGLNGTAC